MAKKFIGLALFLFFIFFDNPFSLANENEIFIDFWPIFQYRADRIKGEKEINGLGPIIFWSKAPDKTHLAMRPIFYFTEDEIEKLIRLEFVYPLGKYEEKDGQKKGYLAPIALYREDEKRWDFQLFPFFIGVTEKGENYFGLFPLFGTLLKRYGKDEIRFFLWPLYSESKSEDVKTTNILWPLFSTIEGEKKKGYRIWPLYGRKEEAGVSQLEFFLWPFFLRQRKALDTDEPIDEWMFFPLYISKRSPRFESKTYLWPFFTIAKDYTSGFEQYDIPWPFFQILKGETEGFRIFPLYGYKQRGEEMRKRFLLFPFLQEEEQKIGNTIERTIRILLISKIQVGSENQKEKERSIRFWPFFEYERGKMGKERFSFLYLLPFKEEGFERNWFPLFRLFQWEKDHRGTSKSNFLWGFYRREKSEERDLLRIAHLLTIDKRKDFKKVSLIKGLIQFKQEGKNSYLRLFYLPFRFKCSQKDNDYLESEEESGNEQKEDRDIGDRVLCSREDPLQFRFREDTGY